VGDDRPLAPVLFDSVHHINPGEVLISLGMGDPPGITRVAGVEVSQIAHVDETSCLIGPRDKADKNVDIKLVQKCFSRSVLRLQILNKLLLIEPAVNWCAVGGLSP
jgi:hypothetical protein